MTRPVVPLARLVETAAVAAVPAGIVLLGLAVLGALSPGAAVLGLAAALLVALLMVRPLLRDLGHLEHRARRCATGEDPGPAPARAPAVNLTAVEALAAALGQMRQQLERSRTEVERLRQSGDTLLDSLPDPLLVVSPERTIAQLNHAARELFGKPDLPGRDLAAALRAPAVLEAVDAVLVKGGTGIVEFTHYGGTLNQEMQATAVGLDRHDPAAPGALVMLHDLTAIHRMERMRADFVANASHELRTPLTSLIGFIETLTGPARGDPEAQERFLGIMYTQATRMRRLIEDLLSLSRIELNEHTRPTGHVDLCAVLEVVKETLDIQAEGRDMAIHLDCDESLPMVPGDADQLTQVFQNLADNALKYGPEGSAVEVTVIRREHEPSALDRDLRGGCLEVAVTDRGDGIPREHLARLTERFYRVDTARSRSLGGTGLGLAIVKHVVSRHRGVLRIDSETGQGSTFRVFLPLHAGSGD